MMMMMMMMGLESQRLHNLLTSKELCCLALVRRLAAVAAGNLNERVCKMNFVSSAKER